MSSCIFPCFADTMAIQEVKDMTARERILMIRLMEKLEKHPGTAVSLGIRAQVQIIPSHLNREGKDRV